MKINRRSFLTAAASATAITVGVKTLHPLNYFPGGITSDGDHLVFPSDGTIKTFIRKYRGTEYELSGVHDWDKDMMKFKVYWRDMTLPRKERVAYALGCFEGHRMPALEQAMHNTIDIIKFEDRSSKRKKDFMTAVIKPEFEPIMYM